MVSKNILHFLLLAQKNTEAKEKGTNAKNHLNNSIYFLINNHPIFKWFTLALDAQPHIQMSIQIEDFLF
tara:strand:- start:252 stop:458 length:207 start_codon:yes stop_codon:yes gene_type:complete